MTECLVEATGLAADDPILVAVLANPPVTPPAPTETQPQAPSSPPALSGLQRAGPGRR